MACDQHKTLTVLFGKPPTDIYVLEMNPRGYDWDLDNVQQLWGDLRSHFISGKELHLNTIMTSPRDKDDWTEEMKDQAVIHKCQFIDLHDGQQRLVTIALLLCALRDYFFEHRSSRNVQVQENAVSATKDIRGFLAPTKVVSTSLEDEDEPEVQYRNVERIWQGSSGNYLKSILLHNGTVPQIGPPPGELENMTYSDRKMRVAHEFFVTEIRNLGNFTRVHLFFLSLTENVTFTDVRYTNSETPMNIILGLHNSKNIEPVDLFRYHLLNAAMPEGGGTTTRTSKSTLATQGKEELRKGFDQLASDTGRAIIHEAFVMAAQFELGEPVDGVGGNPVALFVRYLESKKASSGLSIFDFLKTVAIKWRSLLESDPVFLQDEDWDENLWEKIVPSVEFALALARSRKAKERKEVEKLILRSVLFTVLIPIIHDKPSLKKDIPESLKNQEQVFLWAVFGKAGPRVRQERFSAILADIKRYVKKKDQEQWAEILLDEERREVFDALEGETFGGASYKNHPLTKAILYRLNLSYLSRGGSGNTTSRPEMDHSFVESLPTDKRDNSRKLWNQVLSPFAKSRRGGQTPPQKRTCIVLDDQLSAYPLTKAIRELESDNSRKKFLLEEAKKCWPSPPQPITVLSPIRSTRRGGRRCEE